MQNIIHKAATVGRAQDRDQRSRLYIIYCFLLFAGCGWSPQPQFRLNTEGRDPRSISRDQARAIAGALEKLFGTPDKPTLPQGVKLRLDLLNLAAGPMGSGEGDRVWGLYRKHCVACHGISGDGAGPNAVELNPYPRDFRNGVFKYTSTLSGAKPTQEDLLRTLHSGIPGTAMPSFGKLPEGQIQALVEYVKYLSIRGQTELYLFHQVVDEHAGLPLDMAMVLEQGVYPAAKSWSEAAGQIVIPPALPPTDTIQQLSVSIDRGRELYRTMGAQCFLCHGWVGKGDGVRRELYDDWNKAKKGATAEETIKLAERFQLPLQLLRPRNFTEGIFHGGDRPIDIYRRISVGIKGTPMPGAGPAPGSKGALSPDDIWHVVNYVRSLSEKGSGLGVQRSAFAR